MHSVSGGLEQSMNREGGKEAPCLMYNTISWQRAEALTPVEEHQSQQRRLMEATTA